MDRVKKGIFGEKSEDEERAAGDATKISPLDSYTVTHLYIQHHWSALISIEHETGSRNLQLGNQQKGCKLRIEWMAFYVTKNTLFEHWYCVGAALATAP